MPIPHANRTVDVTLPEQALANGVRVTVKEFMRDLHGQNNDVFSRLFEAFVLLSPNKVRVTCKDVTKADEFKVFGFTFRGQPIASDSIVGCSKFRWVNVTKLSYGIPDEEVKRVLSEYGTINRIKMDVFLGCYVGTRNVLMDIRTPIPSRLRIAGHTCGIFYEGQRPTCFTCNGFGHSSRECPRKKNAPRVPDIGNSSGGASTSTEPVAHERPQGDAPLQNFPEGGPDLSDGGHPPNVLEPNEQSLEDTTSSKRVHSDDESAPEHNPQKRGRVTTCLSIATNNRFSCLDDEDGGEPMEAAEGNATPTNRCKEKHETNVAINTATVNGSNPPTGILVKRTDKKRNTDSENRLSTDVPTTSDTDGDREDDESNGYKTREGLVAGAPPGPVDPSPSRVGSVSSLTVNLARRPTRPTKVAGRQKSV